MESHYPCPSTYYAKIWDLGVRGFDLTPIPLSESEKGRLQPHRDALTWS